MTKERSRPGAWLAIALGVIVMTMLHPARAAVTNRGGPWTFDIRAEAEARYDDNILGLSGSEKDRVDPTDPNNVSRFRIESPEDLIFSPTLAFGFSRKPRRGRETDIGASIGANQYLRNTIKNYHEYSVRVLQELNRSRAHRTALTIGGSRIPSYYLRQLVDDDESAAAGMTVHNSAIYSKNEGYVELSQEIFNRYLSAAGRYSRVRRDFEFHFNERDSSANVERVEINVFPLGRIGLRIRPYAEWQSRSARGDMASTTVSDDDVGFDSRLLGLDLRGIWGRDADHRNTLRGYWQRESRDFTTDFIPDTGHFGREDEIRKYGASYDREFGPRWTLGARVYHRVTDVSLPAQSTSHFTKNVAAVSLGYSFDRRIGTRGEEPREVP
ncbi:MAG TPA: hypothetical protein VGK94_07340 [Candidatus Polarisedimenticolia bacterium]|jgi:hypothetical protein